MNRNKELDLFAGDARFQNVDGYYPKRSADVQEELNAYVIKVAIRKREISDDIAKILETGLIEVVVPDVDGKVREELITTHGSFDDIVADRVFGKDATYHEKTIGGEGGIEVSEGDVIQTEYENGNDVVRTLYAVRRSVGLITLGSLYVNDSDRGDCVLLPNAKIILPIMPQGKRKIRLFGMREDVAETEFIAEISEKMHESRISSLIRYFDKK